MFDLIGTIFIIVLGVLFHFLYDITNHNKIIAYFCAVNESTWEHIKLAIGPAFLWFIFELHYYYGNNALFLAKFLTLVTMIMIIPILFYGYSYFFKKHDFVINILIYVIDILLGQTVFHFVVIHNINVFWQHVGLIGTIIIFLIYLTKTYVPNKNELYKDPITKKYGIKGHK